MGINVFSVFKPKLATLFLKHKYSKETFLSDLTAGVTPQQGLITAIIAGFLTTGFTSGVVSILFSSIGGIEFETIGSRFPQLSQGISLPSPSFPEISLHSARALESMEKIKKREDTFNSFRSK